MIMVECDRLARGRGDGGMSCSVRTGYKVGCDVVNVSLHNCFV